eukprot:6764009-Prymnesium_polylepis.1
MVVRHARRDVAHVQHDVANVYVTAAQEPKEQRVVRTHMLARRGAAVVLRRQRIEPRRIYQPRIQRDAPH